MGQTLTHGVYLPDEGERNCYSGLAANWQLLDGAVGTIAEHTTQIAGKAPAVHTHTKSDITDFPTYGTAAGTICEGNDSRLSDARTPVAHTHTKSDVTDLLNSNFIPSANNSYDLGSSSYQWNNLYAKNYYYNGVAWGLDKVNIWGDDQILEGNQLGRILRLRRTSIQLGDPPPASGFTEVGSYTFADKNNSNMGFMNLRDYANGNTALTLLCRQRYTNGARDTSGNNVEASLVLEVDYSTNRNFYPGTSNTHNLGTSTNKWKTLNGVNPGALSFPSDNPSSVNLDPTNWNTTGSGFNSYIPPSDGWLGVQVKSADATDLTGQYVFVGRSTGGNDYWSQGSISVLKMLDNPRLVGQVFIPVRSGKTYFIRIKINKTQTEGSIILARFYPCEGNV